MKFGVFYEHQLPRPWGDGDEHRLFKQALEEVERADRRPEDATQSLSLAGIAACRADVRRVGDDAVRRHGRRQGQHISTRNVCDNVWRDALDVFLRGPQRPGGQKDRSARHAHCSGISVEAMHELRRALGWEPPAERQVLY